MISPNFHLMLHSTSITQSYFQNFEDFSTPCESSNVSKQCKMFVAHPNCGRSLQLGGVPSFQSGNFLRYVLHTRPSFPLELLFLLCCASVPSLMSSHQQSASRTAHIYLDELLLMSLRKWLPSVSFLDYCHRMHAKVLHKLLP